MYSSHCITDKQAGSLGSEVSSPSTLPSCEKRRFDTTHFTPVQCCSSDQRVTPCAEGVSPAYLAMVLGFSGADTEHSGGLRVFSKLIEGEAHGMCTDALGDVFIHTVQLGHS